VVLVGHSLAGLTIPAVDHPTGQRPVPKSEQWSSSTTTVPPTWGAGRPGVSGARIGG
jgi:hypothetical protein